ncbi:hypothetical protein [Pseudoruegeria sp. HB172150]|uniref:hypothetical protein n=1 Tax=Pseudoruegeria sp. HB172150 TaxID=2721164 RepID=UPI0015574F99|nr:hypothetical protein [Pseudoruegeria sp. HB172150]
MANYTASLMHGNRDAEGVRTFEGPEDLMSQSPVRVMRAFMDWVDAHSGLDHIDFELNAAMKSKDGKTVTALGNLIFDGNSEQPFICMITKT